MFIPKCKKCGGKVISAYTNIEIETNGVLKTDTFLLQLYCYWRYHPHGCNLHYPGILGFALCRIRLLFACACILMLGLGLFNFSFLYHITGIFKCRYFSKMEDCNTN